MAGSTQRPGRRAAGVELAAAGPLHLEATARVLQRRPGNRVDRWENGRYLRVFETPAGRVLVAVQNLGSVSAPALRCAFPAGATGAERREVVPAVRRALGLDLDPAPLEQARCSHPALAAATAGLRGMRPPRFGGLFEAFAGVVPFQQVSIDAGIAIVGRLVERFGTCLTHDGGRYYAFPTAERVADARLDRLRACGLSARKAETLRALARLVAAGEVSEAGLEALPSTEAIAVLCELPGIGPWSAALVLLRGLGRLDVFPPGDVGARRALRALLDLAADADVEAVMERFGALRGYVYFCGLGSALLRRGLIEPSA
ncbi:MAG TPA: AlkA N-terminal domain-containing protein [Pseudomonadales bacterium]